MKLRLSAEPTELERPGSVEIRWTVTGATAVLLSVGGKVDAADALSLTIDETTTIVLTAFDAELGRVAARQVTVTVGERVPRGVIVPWWGDGTEPPEGWAICDGSDGTPDLRGAVHPGADGAGVVRAYVRRRRLAPARAAAGVGRRSHRARRGARPSPAG